MRSRYLSGKAAAFFSGIFFLLALGHAIAQGTASITGTVVDTSQAAVPGSEVTLTNTETAQTTTKTSSDQGFFAFPDLPPGQYKVTVGKNGFKSWSQNAITLSVAQQITLYPQLEVGSASEQVEVTAEAAFLTTGSSTLSGVIESRTDSAVAAERQKCLATAGA